MTYLGRYLNGEYTQTWDDLFQLGPKVRQEPFYTDAVAVARKTMQRVRKNVATLIDRLVQIGFIFGYDHCIQRSLRTLQIAEERRGYLETLTWARQQPPVFLSAHQIEEERAEQEEMMEALFTSMTGDEQEMLKRDFRRVSQEHDEKFPSMSFCIEAIEQLIGPVPLSIRAWYEIVGGVNFAGHHPDWQKLVNALWPNNLVEKVQPTLIQASDPLLVYPLDQAFLAQVRRHYIPGEGYRFAFAPDRYFKDNLSGAGTPYEFSLPDECADVWLRDLSRTFVQYLRTSILTWAGFPGMAEWSTVPEDDLIFLTHDLLPF